MRYVKKRKSFKAIQWIPGGTSSTLSYMHINEADNPARISGNYDYKIVPPGDFVLDKDDPDGYNYITMSKEKFFEKYEEAPLTRAEIQDMITSTITKMLEQYCDKK